jgi:hypothetical protein
MSEKMGHICDVSAPPPECDFVSKHTTICIHYSTNMHYNDAQIRVDIRKAIICIYIV